MAKYVNINDSFSTNGIGSTIDPFNWNQLLSELSGSNGLVNTETYYLSGTRTISNATSIIFSASNSIEIKNWGNPAILQSNNDVYFEQCTPFLTFRNLFMGFNITGTSNSFVDNFTLSGSSINVVIFDNCYLKLGSKARFSKIYSVNLVNSVIIANSFEGFDLNSEGIALSVYNTIFDIGNFNATSANNVKQVLVDNCVFTSAISGFDQDTSTWTNIQEKWTRPSIFSSAVSAINVQNDLKYTSSVFSSITISGSQRYTTTWLDGTRDGVGALYFPTISGVGVSASSANAPLNTTLLFTMSGNNPFTTFSASSATYVFDGVDVSSVNNNSNSPISKLFSSYGNIQYYIRILSFNKWYSIISNASNILIGSFVVKIVIYNKYTNSNLTSGTSKPLTNLVFSAAISGGLNGGSYIWDLDDGFSAISNPSNLYYIKEGNKTIKLSAYSLDNPTFSSTDTSTILISAISAQYFVDITSAYDNNLNNNGTSSDPFNWNEFKGRIETSGEYFDVYGLSGSRVLSASESNRYIINADKTKKYTIRDWDNLNYGPWILEVQDFSTSSNSILSAAGCTLKNGIIYNKPFGYPGYGGKIIITKIYDMFIVYQGLNSNIIIDPYLNYSFESSAVFFSTSSFGQIGPSWAYLPTYIAENFSSGFDPWWSDCLKSNPSTVVISSAGVGVSANVKGITTTGATDSSFWWTTSSAPIHGNLNLEFTLIQKNNTNCQNPSINVYRHSATYTNGGYNCGATVNQVQDELYEITFISCENNIEIQRYENLGTSIIWNNLSASFYPGRVFKMRMDRTNYNTSAIRWGFSATSGTLSGSTVHNWNTTVYETTGTSAFSGDVAILTEISKDFIITDVRFQSTSGFPYINSATSAVTSGYNVSSSPTAEIIGSTVYLSGNGWKDSFNINEFSAFGTCATSYNVEITDSVFVNFYKESSTDFSACRQININNSVFNDSENSIHNF